MGSLALTYKASMASIGLPALGYVCGLWPLTVEARSSQSEDLLELYRDFLWKPLQTDQLNLLLCLGPQDQYRTPFMPVMPGNVMVPYM